MSKRKPPVVQQEVVQQEVVIEIPQEVVDQYNAEIKTETRAINTPNSIKDLGYRVAGTVVTLENQARWAMLNIAGIVDDNVSSEDRAAYDSGSMLRYGESHPDQRYIVTTENLYIPESEKALATCAEKGIKYHVEVLNIYTCMAESQQAYGKHKESSPSLHGIYGAMRTDWSNYKGRVWKALTSKVKELSEGKAKRVAQANDFEVRCSKGFDEWDKGVKNAFKRGDHTAIESRYLAAKAAFWAAWKSYKA
jgi:hypothetical protein